MPFAQVFDGSLDSIYKAGNDARLAQSRRRGDAEGEDFDFGCPSAPDDLIGFMSLKKDAVAADKASEAKVSEARPAKKSHAQKVEEHPNVI